MSKLKRLMMSPITTAVLFALAVVSLVGSAVTAARAASLIESRYYRAELALNSIDIQMTENGNVISTGGGTGALFADMLAEGETVAVGKAYDEELRLVNTGTIAEYFRVKIY